MIVLLRAPRTRHSRVFFLAMMSLALFELHFFGGSRWQSYASLILFNFGGGFALWALLRWLIAFPQEIPESARLNPRWAWLGFLFVVVRMNYIVGGPIPTQAIPFAVLASDGLFIVASVAILTWNTLHAPALGRRRCKWVLLGAYLTTIPMLLSIVPSFIDLEGIDYFETLPHGLLFGAAFPLTTLSSVTSKAVAASAPQQRRHVRWLARRRRDRRNMDRLRQAHDRQCRRSTKTWPSSRMAQRRSSPARASVSPRVSSLAESASVSIRQGA